MNIIDLLKDAHRKACHRKNASTQVLIGSFQVNGNNLIASITAAMQTFGGQHAPIRETYQFISECLSCKDEREQLLFINAWIKAFKIIPGFGSGFIKKQPDPLLHNLTVAFDPSLKYFEYKKLAELITFKSDIWQKKLYPNLAFFTAAIAIEEGININFCESMMLEARIPEWIKMLQYLKNEDHSSD